VVGDLYTEGIKTQIGTQTVKHVRYLTDFTVKLRLLCLPEYQRVSQNLDESVNSYFFTELKKLGFLPS